AKHVPPPANPKPKAPKLKAFDVIESDQGDCSGSEEGDGSGSEEEGDEEADEKEGDEEEDEEKGDEEEDEKEGDEEEGEEEGDEDEDEEKGDEEEDEGEDEEDAIVKDEEYEEKEKEKCLRYKIATKIMLHQFNVVSNKMFDFAFTFETKNTEQERVSMIVDAIKNRNNRDPPKQVKETDATNVVVGVNEAVDQVNKKGARGVGRSDFLFLTDSKW
ncbi:hypothetical protein Tco_1464478, partial [Tanacetum coccineum]